MKNDYLASIWDWIVSDFRSHPIRFLIEITAWTMSIGCAVTLAVTVPNAPWYPLYAAWITSSAMYAWAAWNRKSFGMLANYMLLTGIDRVALGRLFVS